MDQEISQVDFDRTVSAQNAVIIDTAIERGILFVTIVYHTDLGNRRRSQSQTIKLIVNRQTRVQDERGRMINPSELREGMFVNAVFSGAWTRSIPPQAQAFIIRIVGREQNARTTIGRVIEVNNQNNYLLVFSENQSLIRFLVSSQTIIRDRFGRRIRLWDLRIGMRIRVLHPDIMTLSIPPQTNALEITVL